MVRCWKAAPQGLPERARARSNLSGVRYGPSEVAVVTVRLNRDDLSSKADRIWAESEEVVMLVSGSGS